MSFTSDDTFGDKIRPFSEDFNAAMRGVAADLSNLNTYLPILNELILRESPAGAQRSVDTFPALIVGEAQVGGGRYIYDIREVSLLTSEDVNTPAALGAGKGLPSTWLNTLVPWDSTGLVYQSLALLN